MDIFSRYLNRLPSQVFWRLLCYVGLLAALITTNSCASRGAGIPANVILITLDTQRSDHISAYGSTSVKTPNIDYFGQNGIVFENCYSPIPITAPAHASLFYSLPPHELEIYNNGQIFSNDKRLTSLAQVFKKKGFVTAAFVSLGVLKSGFRLNDGFDDYEDSHPEQRWYLHAEEVNERVFPWLDRNNRNNFFIWIHYSDPHDPYAPPSLPPDLKIKFNGAHYKDICLKHEERLLFPFRLKKGDNTIEFAVLNRYPDSRKEYRVSLNDVKYLGSKDVALSYHGIKAVQKGDRTSLLVENTGHITLTNPGEEKEFRMSAQGRIYLLPSEKVAGYRAEVKYMDEQIGRLIGKLNQAELLDKTLVVLVGDHGEGLGDHKTRIGDHHFGHIHFLYSEYLKVPLIIRNPLLNEEATRRKEFTTILDVAPTILEMMGWGKLPFHKGSVLQKTADIKQPLIFGETYRPESTRDRFAGMAYPWHLIFTPSRERYELFNIRDDPSEQHDVYEEKKSQPEITDLRKKVTKKSLHILSQKKDIKLDPKSLEMLRSLGYIE